MIRAAMIGLALFSLVSRASAQSTIANDPRLQKSVSLQISARTVRDVLAEVEVATGVRLFVETELAEEKLCVTATNRTAASVLSGVARFLDLEWKRNAAAVDAGYTLFQTAEAKAAGVVAAGARIKAQRDKILREIAHSKIAAELSAEERNRRNLELSNLAEKTDDRAMKNALISEAYIIRNWGSNDGWRITSALLRELKEPEVISLMSGEGVDFTWPAQSGARPIPTSAVNTARAIYNDASFGSAAEMNAVTIRISPIPGLKPALQCVVFVGRKSTGGSSMRGFSVNLPLFTADEVVPGTEPSSVNWKEMPEFMRKVQLKALVKEHPSKGLPLPILARALADLQKQAAFDCIADAYWSNRLGPVDDRKRPLGDALTELASNTGHTWRIVDGFVMLQSAYASADRMAEPPGDKVMRWAERSRATLLELDDIAEMAMVEDSRFSAMVDLLIDSGMSEEANALSGGRNHLRFYHSLTRAQRRKARELGIVFTDLSEAQQKLFKQAATTRTSSAYTSSFGRELDYSPENNKKLTYRIEFREADLWSYRHPDGIGGATVGGDKEEALEQVRRAFPTATVKDLVPVKSSAALFTYAPQNSYGVRGFVRMPLHLRKPDD